MSKTPIFDMLIDGRGRDHYLGLIGGEGVRLNLYHVITDHVRASEETGYDGRLALVDGFRMMDEQLQKIFSNLCALEAIVVRPRSQNL